MTDSPQTFQTLQLNENGVHAVTVSAKRPLTVSVRSGAVWITQVGKPQDMVLHAGQSMVLNGYGRFNLGALDRTCTVQISTVTTEKGAAAGATSHGCAACGAPA